VGDDRLGFARFGKKNTFKTAELQVIIIAKPIRVGSKSGEGEGGY
jgi:hypothetical protein